VSLAWSVFFFFFTDAAINMVNTILLSETGMMTRTTKIRAGCNEWGFLFLTKRKTEMSLKH